MNQAVTKVPAFLASAGVKQYGSLSVEQLQKFREPSYSLLERTWAVLVLHSNFYQSEICVKQVKVGQKFHIVPLTIADIRKELNDAAILAYRRFYGRVLTKEEKIAASITPQNFRKGLAQLEEYGVCVRKLAETGEVVRDLPEDRRRSLHQDAIQVFLTFRPDKNKGLNPLEVVKNGLLGGSPDQPSLFHRICRLGIRLQPDQITLFESRLEAVEKKLAEVEEREQAAKAAKLAAKEFVVGILKDSVSGGGDAVRPGAETPAGVGSVQPPAETAPPPAHPDQAAEPA